MATRVTAGAQCSSLVSSWRLPGLCRCEWACLCLADEKEEEALEKVSECKRIHPRAQATGTRYTCKSHRSLYFGKVLPHELPYKNNGHQILFNLFRRARMC